MRKKIRALLPFLWLLFYPTTLGAESLKIETLEVQVMPEFVRPDGWPEDKPTLLTGIYGAFINEGTAGYAGEITLQIPKAPDTSVHLVGEFKDGENSETQVQYTLDAKQGTVTWKPLQTIEPGKPYYFVVEYYSNPFSLDGTARSFTLPFTSKYDIKNLQFYFYKPLQSIGFTLSEAHQQQLSNEFNQEVFQITAGAFASNQEKSISVSYMKENFQTVLEQHSTTAEKPESTEAAGTEAASTAQQPDASKDAWIIGGSIVIFGILVFMGLRSYRAPAAVRMQQPVKKINPKQRQKQIRALRRKLVAQEVTEAEYLEQRKQLG